MKFPKIIGALIVGSILLTGCKSLVEDQNIDPNNFTSSTVDLKLNQASLATATISNQHTARISTMFSDQMTGTDRQYRSYNSYSVNRGNFDASWEDLYIGVASAQLAKQQAAAEGLTTLEGAAQILEGYYFGEGAALFGDIPYSQANNIDQYPQPKFDGQIDVLKGVISSLDNAIGKVGDTKVTADAGKVFSTSSTWAQVANGLKARYSLLLKDYPAAETAAIAANMTSNGNSLTVETSSSNYKENLWWQFEIEQRSDYLSIGNSTFKQMLTDTGQLSRMNVKTNDAQRYDYFITNVFNKKGELIRLKYNTDDGKFAGKETPLEVISAREVQLILAEAAARNGNTATAITALNTARNLMESIVGGDGYQDYDEDDFKVGGIANYDGKDVQESLIYEILREKFLSVIGLPTFYDVNRTNNILGVAIKNTDATSIPQRFFYPSSELSSNPNCPKDVSLYEKTEVNK